MKSIYLQVLSGTNKMSADNNFVRATQKSILDILVSSRISAQEVNFEHEAALSSFFDGSSVAARMFEAEPNAITSGGVVWGGQLQRSNFR